MKRGKGKETHVGVKTKRREIRYEKLNNYAFHDMISRDGETLFQSRKDEKYEIRSQKERFNKNGKQAKEKHFRVLSFFFLPSRFPMSK